MKCEKRERERAKRTRSANAAHKDRFKTKQQQIDVSLPMMPACLPFIFAVPHCTAFFKYEVCWFRSCRVLWPRTSFVFNMHVRPIYNRFFCSCHNCVSLHSNERIYAKAFVLLYFFSIVYVYICLAFCLFKFIYNLFIFIIIIPSHPLAVLAGAMIDFVFFCTILLFSSFRRYNLYAYRFEQVHEICSFSTVAIAIAFRVVYLCVLEAIN